MRYAAACVAETMRLRPPVGGENLHVVFLCESAIASDMEHDIVASRFPSCSSSSGRNAVAQTVRWEVHKCPQNQVAPCVLVAAAQVRQAVTEVGVGGAAVPAGSTVIVHLARTIARDARWCDGEGSPDSRYLPQRFLTAEGARQGEQVPFGLGMRTCVGMPLAQSLVCAGLGYPQQQPARLPIAIRVRRVQLWVMSVLRDRRPRFSWRAWRRATPHCWRTHRLPGTQRHTLAHATTCPSLSSLDMLAS